jgi:polyphosphate kinase
MCSLQPGVPHLSENIRVRSIVGRFLEHSRIYWFQNNGHPEIYLGSADVMERNLDRRVETLFPVRSKPLAKRVKLEVLDLGLSDNVKAWELVADGRYERVSSDGARVNSQMKLLGVTDE